MSTAADGAPENGVSQKKQILLNAFDMSTVGHLSPGQWKVRERDSREATKTPVTQRLSRILKINRPQNRVWITG